MFSTWFSGAVAHILGIQALPMNPLTLHVGQHTDYLVDYVALGLSESSNGKPSGLADGEWRDIWWNVWAMADADAAIADYDAVGASYVLEEGETTYVVYNFSAATQSVTYSDGHAVSAAPLGFTITTSE